VKTSGRKPLKPGEKVTIGGVEFERSTGNIFRDLGLPEPELHQTKVLLARQINATIKAKGWSQAKAAAALGTSQPTISLLSKGMLSSVTYDRLISWLVILKQNITIRISPAYGYASIDVEVAPPARGLSRAMSVYERGARKYRKRPT